MVSSGFLKRSFILSIAVIVGVGAILPLLVLPVSAAAINNASATDEAKSTSYYRTLRTCVNNEMNTTIQLTGSDNGVADPSKWFTDNYAYGYIFPEGKTDCKDIMPKALSLWGWGTDYSAFLQALGFTYNASDARWTVANRDNLRSKFDSAVQAKYYGINFTGDPVQSGAARYEMFLNVFNKACNAKDLGTVSSITNTSYKAWLNESTSDRGTQVSKDTANVSGTKAGQSVYFSKVNVAETVNGGLKLVPHGYAYQASSAVTNAGWNGENATANGDVRIYGYHNSAVERSCHQIQKGVTDNAAAWLAWARAQSVPVVPPASTGSTTPSGDGEGATTSSCLIEGVGWIVCPVLTFMGSIVDGAYNFVSGLLVIQPLVTTGDNRGAYRAWAVMRSIANIAFVIAFLVIIFSQLMGVGVSNYGVKKLLPRLVIAAILVNVSFWICAIAIDLSNIIGASVVQIFDSVGTNINTNLSGSIGESDKLLNGGQWTDIVGGVVAGTAVGIGLYYVTLSALIPALLAALVAIVAVFLVLALRQALIILLIVIAPLAFVAYLLPNTEDLFNKWRKIFMTLLLMYPIIAGLFGASALASMIIMKSADGNMVVQIMGACIAILPLAITPLVMKSAGGLLNRFGGVVNNANKGPIDRLKNSSRKYTEGKRKIRDGRALGGQKQFGRGSFVKWRARRNAIDTGAGAVLSRAEQKYVAGAMTDKDGKTTSFANKVAGAGATSGFNERSAADPASLQRALAGAKFTIERAELEDVKAEQSLISNLDMVKLNAALSAPGISPARAAAVIDRMIKIGEPADYKAAVNQYGNDTKPENSVLRQSIANSLRENGPKFIKESDLDSISTGNLGGRTLESLARDNVKQGVYSEEKLVIESSANLKFAFGEANLEGKQLMVNNAAKLKANPTLNGKIKHNAKSIDNLASAKAPDAP